MGDLKYFSVAIFLILGLFLAVLSILVNLFNIPGFEIMVVFSLISLSVSLILYVREKTQKK
jgi:hypothetical protein